MTAQEAIAGVKEAFAQAARPARFTRGTCFCDECVEHGETLAAHTPETIGMDQLGHPAWDPICMANDQAFAYYLPVMARLALEDDYCDQFLFHLNVPGRVDALTARQARSLLDVLWVLAEVKGERVFAPGTLYQHQLEEAMQHLEYRALDDQGKGRG